MTASDDAVLAYWHDHREQFRQSEYQRAVLTNYVLVIAAEGAAAALPARRRCQAHRPHEQASPAAVSAPPSTVT